MREYVLFESRYRLAYGRWTAALRLFKNWRLRRDIRRILAMDDYLLRDIGLTRSELHQLLRLPLSADWQWEAERRKAHRHAADRAANPGDNSN